MKIIVAGGSGLIGQRLSAELAGRGHELWVLTRSPGEASLPAGVRAQGWDGKTVQGWGELVDGAGAVINLAGVNIGARPWTNERKRLILSSRENAGRALVEAIRQASDRPNVVLQIAGIGIYGNCGDLPLDENAPRGSGYLADVGAAWEAAIQPVTELGPRLAILRTSPVLAPKGGILPPFLLQNRLFAGGPLGSGRQWISWIHLNDLVRAFCFLLDQEDVRGIFNVSAPDPKTNADFGRAVSRVMRRPFWFPTPAFALKAVLGEMSTLVLEGQRIVPKRLLEMGFHFEYDTLQKALQDLIQ